MLELLNKGVNRYGVATMYQHPAYVLVEDERVKEVYFTSKAYDLAVKAAVDDARASGINNASPDKRCAEIPYFFLEQDYDILCYCESEDGLLVNTIPILRNEKPENWETYKYLLSLEQQHWEWVEKDERAAKIVKNIYDSSPGSSSASGDSSGVFWVEGTPDEDPTYLRTDKNFNEILEAYQAKKDVKLRLFTEDEGGGETTILGLTGYTKNEKEDCEAIVFSGICHYMLKEKRYYINAMKVKYNAGSLEVSILETLELSEA